MSDKKQCHVAARCSKTPPSSVAGQARTPATADPTTSLESISFARASPDPCSNNGKTTKRKGAPPMNREPPSCEDRIISEEAALSPPVSKPAATASISANTTNEVNESEVAIESSSSEVAADVKADVPEFVPPQEPPPTALLHSNSGAFILRPSATAAAPEAIIALGHRRSSSFVAAVTEQRSELSQPRAAADAIPFGAGAPSGETASREGVGGTPGAVHIGGRRQSMLQSSLGSAGGSVAAQSPQDYVATAAVVDDSGWEEEVQRLERQNEALEDENEMLRRAQMATAEAVEVCIEPVSGGQPPRDNEQGGEEGDVGRVGERTFRKKLRNCCLLLGVALLVVAAGGITAGLLLSRGTSGTGGTSQAQGPDNSPKSDVADKQEEGKMEKEEDIGPPIAEDTIDLTPATDAQIAAEEQRLIELVCDSFPPSCLFLEGSPTTQRRAIQHKYPSDSSILTRYSLAVLWLSTRFREVEVDREGWMDYRKDECEWEGVYCSEEGKVEVLDMGGFLEEGTVPSELALLGDGLEGIYLYNNDLSGRIPTEVGQVTNLKKLSLYGNRLSGQIPTQVGNLSQLEILKLNDNEFSGLVPTQVGQLMNLKYLYLSGNRLSGKVPSEMGNLSQLEYLSLHDNNVTGTIPEEVCRLRTPSGTLRSLWADCDEEVQCDCCTHCCFDGVSFCAPV